MQIGVPLDVFWFSTPIDFSLMVEAHRKREEHQMEKLAWVCANIMSVQVARKDKHKVSVDALLGRTKDLVDITSDADFRRHNAAKQALRDRA